MQPEPLWESHSHPDETGQAIAIPIAAADGQLTLEGAKTATSSPAIDHSTRWTITYTLKFDGLERTELLGYAASYHDLTTALTAYLDAIRSVSDGGKRPPIMALCRTLERTRPAAVTPP
ncbi:hypothetical protein [Halocatena halophila]|uniref:hypothetical protein n=1 Tax=Halocatena halophila TaxID=2814576 RepID=UPI002ED5952F